MTNASHKAVNTGVRGKIFPFSILQMQQQKGKDVYQNVYMTLDVHVSAYCAFLKAKQ